ncbi:phosphoadenylyl-sulfate reductase [Humisphaera borealis]|uniref:Adenosine 5'-phosphosulfate reductase n=1 Tax=Humisphaera borealis TaxID=2807512 RepID=A0A7M2WX95_9BACT|nr:phosphoadenylyl-sulfate reductase [Humisphaera borealis]QOV89441.1 phosphoadenylyl-sulfate reductase [Humisphaera borealis]
MTVIAPDKPQVSTDPLDLEAINPMLESQDPAGICRWASAQFGGELVMTSSFGAESALLLHLATRVKPDIKVIMIDTGYLFPETWQHMEALRRRLDLNVWVYRTKNDPIAWLGQNGEGNASWRNDVDRCCNTNKNEPMERAMAELRPSAWLRGIRRNQADTRKEKPFVEWSKRYRCYAVSPLLNWSTRDIYLYMKQNELPYHPLYEKGYLSIGCNPESCTRAVKPGEDPRAGRWSGTDKIECGINVNSNSLDSAGL